MPQHVDLQAEVKVMTRRRFFAWVGGVSGASAAFPRILGPTDTAAAAGSFEVTRSEGEWRKVLSAEQFAVLRKHGTERPWTSPLNKEYGRGTYVCAGCELPLFASDTKFDSGTGWPSFWAPLAGAIGTSVDSSFFMRRTEVHCRRCGGHLGHVFDDGPKPTGLRYCINGVSLKFIPA
jgi:peptide-methionine (R)-S-oxide reductase